MASPTSSYTSTSLSNTHTPASLCSKTFSRPSTSTSSSRRSSVHETSVKTASYCKECGLIDLPIALANRKSHLKFTVDPVEFTLIFRRRGSVSQLFEYKDASVVLAIEDTGIYETKSDHCHHKLPDYIVKEREKIKKNNTYKFKQKKTLMSINHRCLVIREQDIPGGRMRFYKIDIKEGFKIEKEIKTPCCAIM